MNKHLVLLMFVFSEYSYCSAYKNTFKKLLGKKIASTYKDLDNFNLFQCFSYCEKNKNCKIFNYNAIRHLCQLSDNSVDDYLDLMTNSDEWDVYITTMELINFTAETTNYTVLTTAVTTTISSEATITTAAATEMSTLEAITETTSTATLTTETTTETTSTTVTLAKATRTGIEKTVTVLEFGSQWNRTKIDHSINSNKLTICTWVSIGPDASNDNRVLFNLNTETDCQYLVMWISDTVNKLKMEFRINGQNSNFKTEILSTNRYYHVCLVYDTGNLTLYLNGEIVETGNVNIPPENKIEVESLFIGKSFNQQCENRDTDSLKYAFLYDFNIYLLALTEAEVKAMMNGTSAHVGTVKWKDVKQKFAGVENIQLKSISKLLLSNP